jgi:NAD(P)-dependent dehydrogenase (short-subunit alcohol dehydrogenase family)
VFDLSGRVALVTGAGGTSVGTGAAIARGLAAQGALVVVNDVDGPAADRVVDEITAAGGGATAAIFDVTDQAAVLDGVSAAAAAVGPIDILVASAGGGPVGLFRDMDPDVFERSIRLNLFGAVHCTRAVVDGMCERAHGRVIVVASSAGSVGLSMGVSAYGAAKAGVAGFVRHLAAELGPSGVTVNAVAPGLVTSGIEAFASAPVKRTGVPDDIGPLCVYLASEESAYMTGQTVHINGGSYMG